ncbi:MAG: TonB-dependent receptor [Bacteroidales bacterium]|nr:TonB-dependent receptor [Candidatus Physcousia equi]
MTPKHILPFLLFTATAQPLAAQDTAERSDTIAEVVVTGSNDAMPRHLLPYTVSVVSRKQIEATGSSQLLSALAGRVPSLFVTQRNVLGFGISNGGSGGIKVRGVGSSPTSQVLMMVDGKPQFAGVFSHHVADNYESDYVDHVEIVRGPSSVLYGSNAMGGTINVITRTPHADGVRTTLQSQFGSYATWQTSATNMVRQDKFSSLVSLGYDRTNGTQQDFDFWQASGYAKLGYDFSPHWSVCADYALMKFKGNDPIYATLDNPASTDVYHQDVLRGEASIVASNRYAHANGAMRIYYAHGNHNIEDPKPFNMKDDRLGVLAYQNFQPWRMTHLTIGFDFDRYTGEVPRSGGVWRADKKTPATMDRQCITEYSPYLTFAQGVWDNLLVLHGGLRVANSNRFGTHLVPQVGVALNPGLQWTLKLNASKGYRNPSFKELYLYKMANPELKPEQMWNYELSLAKRFSHLLAVELTGFVAQGSHIIQQVFSKELGSQHNENTGDFVNKGLEISLASQPAEGLSLRATYSFLHSNVKQLTAAPRHLYSLSADWAALPRLVVNADLTGASRLFVADDVPLQAYALLNMRFTYKPLRLLDLFLQANNLTHARYSINKGYTMPGINVSAGFKLHL